MEGEVVVVNAGEYIGIGTLEVAESCVDFGQIEEEGGLLGCCVIVECVDRFVFVVLVLEYNNCGIIIIVNVVRRDTILRARSKFSHAICKSSVESAAAGSSLFSSAVSTTDGASFSLAMPP